MKNTEQQNETAPASCGNTLLSTVVTFPENKFVYYQDHRWHSGIPAGVEFTIKSEAGHDDFWLAADGYGNLSKPNCYGNGEIAVQRKDIEWALKQ